MDPLRALVPLEGDPNPREAPVEFGTRETSLGRGRELRLQLQIPLQGCWQVCFPHPHPGLHLNLNGKEQLLLLPGATHPGLSPT